MLKLWPKERNIHINSTDKSIIKLENINTKRIVYCDPENTRIRLKILEKYISPNMDR